MEHHEVPPIPPFLAFGVTREDLIVHGQLDDDTFRDFFETDKPLLAATIDPEQQLIADAQTKILLGNMALNWKDSSLSEVQMKNTKMVFDVFVSSPVNLDKEMFNMWLEGYSGACL
jgi:hypothetical protein